MSKNINYPDSAKIKGQSGTVYIQFFVENDGEITNINLVRGVSEELDKEALLFISKMPKWIPGKRGGVPVRVMYTFPIKFELK